uniref:Uncharacterized protein n=1 Tax=Romanomermis culicivorax TaxID=13658 RepID=A0A915HZP2_ROMCU
MSLKKFSAKCKRVEQLSGRQMTKWINLYAESYVDAMNNVNKDWAIKDAAIPSRLGNPAQ